ncbi:MAG TPA: DUF2243 domain-containing protein [Anaerolineales bacterium]|nr:DUF2243 domain-containing protein [Anaerolineales bacterium]
MSQTDKENGRGFPTVAGIFLGLGLGGFFDGIILHQVLQWHHMLTSAGYPADTLGNLEFNVMWDGLFHISTYMFTAIGLMLLARHAFRPHAPWSGKMLAGAMFMGFGIFNLVEGIIDHQILGIHHVNETVPQEQWIYWDLAFLVWGALMFIGGWFLWKAGKQETAIKSAAMEQRRAM